MLVEKNGIRAIERIMEIHHDTVSDVIEDLARHARDVTDFLIYIAKTAETKLHLAHGTGKRIQDTADKLMETVRKQGKIPTKNEKAIFFSDGNDQYTKAIIKNFDVETINYGQLIKEREEGRVVGKTRTIIFGESEYFLRLGGKEKAGVKV